MRPADGVRGFRRPGAVRRVRASHRGTCGAHADVTWTEIMSLSSHVSELTKAGVDGTMNGRNNLSASVSAAPTSQLATVGGGGRLGI